MNHVQGIRIRGIGLTIVTLFLASLGAADEYSVPWGTVDGGGAMFTAGGVYGVSGTAGQQDAGVLSGGDYEVIGGFWAIRAYVVGDLNCDGAVDFGDINPFVLRLSNPGQYQSEYPGCPDENADIDEDGVVGFGDINPFVALLSAGGG
jgi:hypothetical protein